MAEYKYVDWTGLQYYHSKVTDLIDSRLRDCIRFGGEVQFEALESPDTPDLNIIYRVLNSFTVSPSNEWFDDSTWNKTYPAGTLLQVVQTAEGVVYTVFMQPATGGGGATPDVDLSNYYTIAEVDAKIIDALKPYATVEFVTLKLDAIQALLNTHIDEFGKLTSRVDAVEQSISSDIQPAIKQLEEAVTEIAETKADVSDIPSLEGYATETFVAAKIAEAELAGGDVDLSGYYTKDETYNKEEVNALIPDLSDVARKSDLEGLATEAFVATVVGAIEIPEVPTKISELENDVGYLTEHQDLSGKADREHKHSMSDITDYEAPDLSGYAKKEDIPEVDLSNFYNKTEVENIVDEAVGNISVPEVPTNVSAFVNDAGYITEKDLPDLSEYAKVTDIPDVSDFATEDFVKQKIAEAQLSDGEVDLSAFYTKEEIEAKGFATEEYVQQQLDEADVVGMDARLTQVENQSTTNSTKLNELEDQSDANAAAITALDGEIDQVNATLLTMDTQITNISQNLADLQAYGTF